MTTNYQRVTEGIEILTKVLAPYVARELRAHFGDEWWDRGVLDILYDNQKRGLPAGGLDDELIPALDAARCLILIDVQWNELFRRKLGREHRTWVKELTATRNKWAHQGLHDWADEDAWRALDTMTRLVEPMDSEATERLRTLARTVRYGIRGSLPTARGPADEWAAGHRRKENTGVLTPPAAVTALPSKAARIRALVILGWSDGDIARSLGVSHQHAYNEARRPTRNYDPAKYGRA